MFYLDKLQAVFDRLLDDIAYLQVKDNYYCYKQKDHYVSVTDLCFDIKASKFISARTIKSNREVINKLIIYDKNRNRVSLIDTQEGFKALVYNKYGGIIYRGFIKFYDRGLLGKFTHMRLKFLHPELLN